MSTQQSAVHFFQSEAREQLDQLDQLVDVSEGSTPEPGQLVSYAGAIRGGAILIGLDGLPDLAGTIERIAVGLGDGELRWDQRLQFALRGALAELRALVESADNWGDAEQRRSRTQSVALAAVAAGYLAASAVVSEPSGKIVPISRLFHDDGLPAILHRNPSPASTLAQSFRTDIAASANAVDNDASALSSGEKSPNRVSLGDSLRRALLLLSDMAESYGAASIATLAVRMARAPLAEPAERSTVAEFTALLQNRNITDQELAARVKSTSIKWEGQSRRATSPTNAPAINSDSALVPIDKLLYRGQRAIERAREVRDEIKLHRRRGTLAEASAGALLDELSDLLDLAATT